MFDNLTKSQRLMIIIGISASFFIAEIAAGFYTRSIALVADAFHYLNDLIGFIVALVAFRASEQGKPPKKLAFGWQRANLLGAFFNGVFLVALGVSIFLQSIERFVSIERIENPRLVLIIGCIGFSLNMVSAVFLHEHEQGEQPASKNVDVVTSVPPKARPTHGAHRHTSMKYLDIGRRKGHDLGLLGVMIHVLGDAANNVGVIIAATVIWKAKYEGRFYADPAVSMAIAIMIFLSSIPLVKKSGSILLQSVPSGVDPDDVKHDIETIPGILGVHDLHIWQLNQQKTVATAHLIVDNDSMEDFMKLGRIVTECLHAYGIHSATLQPEGYTESRAEQSPAPDTATSQDITNDSFSRRHPTVSTTNNCRIGCRTTTCDQLQCCE